MSDPKIYVGTRDLNGCRVQVIEGNRASSLRHVVLHSADGFEWGYAGSGPADLALSILADALGERPTSADLYAGVFQCTTCHGEGGDEVCSTCKGRGDLGEVKCQKLHQPYKFEVVCFLDRHSWKISETAVLDWFAGKLPEELVAATEVTP